MNRNEIITLLRENQQELERIGIKSLSLFGSVARDEANPESDVDLLIDLETPHTFDRYIRALFFLEDLLGCSVDLVMQETLKPQIRSAVEKDLVHVA